MLAIFKREFKSYFTTPIGYIVLAAFYLFLGLYFWLIFMNSVPQVEYVISNVLIVVVLGMPIITMRLMSEDRRQKVDQALFTAPVKLVSIVMGKYLAALSIFALCFAPTIIFEIIIMSFAKVNILIFLYSLLGMLLLGSAFIAIGMFVSCLTESPVISAFVSLVINILVAYMSSIASFINVKWVSTVAQKLAFIDVYANFSDKYFSLPDVIYFVSITVAFLFLCTRVLEKRRWA